MRRSARFWYGWSAASFLRAYLEQRADSRIPAGSDHDMAVLLNAHMLEKAAYELRYEANNRDWVQIQPHMLQLLEGTT